MHVGWALPLLTPSQTLPILLQTQRKPLFMDIATSTHNQNTYTAYEFDKQPDDVKATHRPNGFTCPSCAAPAAFRTRSRDGRAACFTAQHTPTCNLRSTAWNDQDAEGVTDVPLIDNSGAIIRLTLDGLAGGMNQAPAAATATAPDQDGPTRHHTAAAGTFPREYTTKRLRALLRQLRNHPELAASEQLIELPSTEQALPVREAVRRADQITQADADQPRLIWGVIATVSTPEKGQAVFLRCGAYEDRPFYVRLPVNLSRGALEALGWAEWREARGAHIIACGTLRYDANDAPYISAATLNQLYLLP